MLAERELHILAVPTLTVPQLEIQTRNVHAQVVMVDYLGLLSTADRRASEYERVTQVSGDLKRMAKRMNCVVIALCQLNREATTASVDSRPKLSQLRSSGAIEQDATAFCSCIAPNTDKVKYNEISGIAGIFHRRG